MVLNSNLTLSNVELINSSRYSVNLDKYILNLSSEIDAFPIIIGGGEQSKINVTSNSAITIDTISSVGTLTVSGTTALTVQNSYPTMINVNTLTLEDSATLSTSTINIKNITTVPDTCTIKIIENSQLNIYGTVASNINVEANDFTLSETTKPTIIVLANGAYSEKINLKINDVDYILSKTGTDSNSVSGYDAYSYTPIIETSALTLTYSNITKRFGTFDEAVEYIDSLNSSSNAYKIVFPNDENVAVERFPLKAGSITFESNNRTFDLSGINVTYPLTFNSTNTVLTNCTLGNVTINSGKISACVNTSSIKTLTLNSASLEIDAPLSVTTLVTTSDDDENCSQIVLNTNDDFTINAISLKDKKQIKLSTDFSLDNNTELIKDVGSTVLPTCFTFESSNNLALIKEGTTIKTATSSIAVSTVDGGNFVGNYATWQDAVNAINAKNDLTTEYKVTLSADTEINTLPTKCNGLIIYSFDRNNIFIPTTFSQTVPVYIYGCVVKSISDNTIPTWKTNGKDLTLDSVIFNGNITGTTTGSLYVTGTDIFGSVSTFKDVDISNDFNIHQGNLTSITNLNFSPFANLNINNKKTMSVTNINTADSASLKYSYSEDSDFRDNSELLPNVTVSGNVTGGKLIIEISKPIESDTKILTASKATADCFEIDGDNLTTYKTGTGIYAGEKTFALYCGEDKIADYALWSDVLAYINKQTTAQDYTVELLADCDLNGAFTTPAKTKCTSLTIKSDDTLRTLKATSMTLTTDVTFDNVFLKGEDTKGNEKDAKGNDILIPISLSTNGNVTFKSMVNGLDGVKCMFASITKTGTTPACVTLDNCELISNGTFSVDKVELKISCLALKSNSVIKSVTCDEGSFICILSGKSLTINSIEDRPLNIHITNDNYDIIDPQANSTVLTTTDVSSNQIKLEDSQNKDVGTYRSGNYIKVAEDKPLLNLSDGSSKSFGTFNSLQDMNTEIARRNDKTANYYVIINKNIDLTTAFPFPTAGKYNQITYSPSSEDIQVTCGSDIVLTGNTAFDGMNIKKVSKTSRDALPINVSLGAYSLTLSGDTTIEKLTNITGSTASELHLNENDVVVLGNITGLGTLSYDGENLNTIKVYGNISVANINVEKNANEYLEYLPTKTISISNVITTNGTPLILCPLEYNNDSSDYENISAQQYSSLKVITSAPKITTTSIIMKEDTDLVFYKDGSAVKLGEPVIEVKGTGGYTYKFARFNDAMDFANADYMDIHTLTLIADVQNAGALKMPSAGKGVTVTKADSDDEERTLNFTGSVALTSDNSNIIFLNMILNNNSTNGVATTVTQADSSVAYDKCDVNLYTMSGAGTIELDSNKYTVNGTVSGTLSLLLVGTDVLFKNNVTVKELQNRVDNAKIRKVNGKLFIVSGDVSISADEPVKFNVVNTDGTTLSTLKSGTTLLTAPYATAAQFTTDNTMADNETKWLITKSGTAIKTAGVAAYAYLGDRQTDVNHQFASFNEAKEYISTQVGNWTIELTENSTGADLTDLSANLAKIVCTGDSPVTLTTTSDINLSANLKIDNVIITATSKTVNANEHSITLDNGAKLTAGKAIKLNYLTINGLSVVTFSYESEINSISLYHGNIKCPSIVSFEIGGSTD